MSFLRALAAPRTRGSGLTLTEEQVAAAIAGSRGAGSPTPSVTGVESLRNPHVWSAVRLTADALASMPAHAYATDANGAPRRLDTQPQFLREPMAGVDFGEWLYAQVAAMMTGGNAYNEVVDTDTDGGAVQVEEFDPASVTVTEKQRGAGGRLELVSYRAEGRRIAPTNMLHLSAYRWPGTRVGLAPVDYARRQVLLGILAERFGLEVYKAGGRVTGILSSDQELNPEQSAEIAAQWRSALGRSTVPVLGKGTKFERVQLTLQEAQALDVQRWSGEQVARVFGIPPELLALGSSGSSVTYANRTQAVTGWHQMSLAGWQRRIEGRLTRALDPTGTTGTYVKLNAAGLLRSSPKERWETYAIGLASHALHVDEVRAWEELEPRDDLGTAPTPGAVAFTFDEHGNPTGVTPATGGAA